MNVPAKGKEDSPRKKSPRAPSISLDEAIDGAIRVYEREKKHAAPADAVAQALGYKSANNGAALASLASLRYYGLIERLEEGKLAVSKEVEAYQYAPDETIKRNLLNQWLKNPPVFAELLERYGSGLPSDATLRFDLIKRGFTPVSAESVIDVFKRSVGFAKYFESPRNEPPASNSSGVVSVEEDAPQPTRSPSPRTGPLAVSNPDPDDGHDRIPVRLNGGRRAWLVIPTPFYEADKKRLKAQIDLLLSEDEEPPLA